MLSYTDIALKRQAILERLKSGQVRNFSREIKKFDTLVRHAFGTLEDEVSNLSRAKLENLIALIRVDQGKVFAAATENFLGEAEKIAVVHMNQELLDLNNAIDLTDAPKLKAFTKPQLYRKVIQRPLGTNGDLLGPWIKNFTRTETNRVSGVIRAGHSRGLTNQQMVRSIVGSKALNYRDGILETTRRNASTVVRTSVQHVANSARQEVWEANTDVVKRYKFLATLDGKTSNVCRGLDNREFDFGKGPVPPVHPNCRSTTIPVLSDKYKFLSEGRTRSSTDGPIPADQSYYDWLKKQDKKTQDQVLGKTRSKLLRDGGMSAEKFRALQYDKNFQPLTLSEMRQMEPKAFVKADLVPKGGQARIDWDFPPANKNGIDTFERHSINGVFTPERQKLHDDIVNDFFRGVTPTNKPLARMTGGGSASGKGFVLREFPATNSVVVDSDEIKKLLPEYRLGLKLKDANAARFAHEESSYLSKRILAESAKRKTDMLLDGTGDGGIESLRKKTKLLKSGGHRLEADYVTVDTAEAIRRNVERAKKTGRMVPESFVEKVHSAVSEVLPQAMDENLFDRVTLWDTNTPGKQIRVMDQINGVTTIHRPDLWQRFLDKAK